MAGLRRVPFNVRTLAMSDAPSSSGAEAELVSLFQTDTIAFKGIVTANWELQRVDGAVVITGINYAVSAQS